MRINLVLLAQLDALFVQDAHDAHDGSMEKQQRLSGFCAEAEPMRCVRRALSAHGVSWCRALFAFACGVNKCVL